MEPLTNFKLGKLADSGACHEPIELENHAPEKLLAQLKLMALIRAAEERIGDEYSAGVIRCPCHLAIGQEAIPVAVSQHLIPTDRVFGTHRSHGHFLAQGGTVEELFAEVLGKVTGCSKGMGGSMHLFKGSTGFFGSVPIVSATVSVAVGAALASKLAKKNDIGVAYFGDGAMEEGSVHESLNFASHYKLPMLFVCENNLFSSHLHINQRQPSDSVARFAAASGLAYEVVDGNDTVALLKATKRLVDRARSGEGAGFLEAVTYRWRGHVGPSEDIDVGVNRKGDLHLWKKRDPISRLRLPLEKVGVLKPGEWDQILSEIRETIAKDWQKALAAPYPEPSALLDPVWSST